MHSISDVVYSLAKQDSPINEVALQGCYALHECLPDLNPFSLLHYVYAFDATRSSEYPKHHIEIHTGAMEVPRIRAQIPAWLMHDATQHMIESFYFSLSENWLSVCANTILASRHLCCHQADVDILNSVPYINPEDAHDLPILGGCDRLQRWYSPSIGITEVDGEWVYTDENLVSIPLNDEFGILFTEFTLTDCVDTEDYTYVWGYGPLRKVLAWAEKRMADCATTAVKVQLGNAKQAKAYQLFLKNHYRSISVDCVPLFDFVKHFSKKEQT